MTLDATLQRAQRDVEDGDLGKARDRLEGLLVAYPEELRIRMLLGEIYWDLRYPDRAGRLWYLLPSENEHMEKAKAAFRARYGGDARFMLAHIGYRGGMEAVRGTYAEGILLELATEAGIEWAKLGRLVSNSGSGRPGICVDWRVARLAQLVSAARSVVTYESGMPHGCRRMSSILGWLPHLEVSGRRVIEEYYVALAELPCGSDRLLWNREALRQYDVRLEALNRVYRDRVFEACWDIIDRYGSAARATSMPEREQDRSGSQPQDHGGPS